MHARQVVVAFDFTEDANCALDRALDLVGWNPDHVLHVVTVIKQGQSYERAEEIRLWLLDHLQREVAARQLDDRVQVFAHVRIGRPDEEILGVAEDLGADLIIVGSHDRGPIGRSLHGSVSDTVLHGAQCPVMVARRKGYSDVKLEKIVEVPHHKLRPLPHRYSYTSAIAQVRPADWPLA